VRRRGLRLVASRARAWSPSLAECFRAVASALLLLLAFPDFDLWPLAWVALSPLLFTIVARPRAPQSFLAGWLAGTVFFYASCQWLTYPMIHYAELPAWLAHVLLLPAALAGGLFVGLFALGLAAASARWGARALALAPALWVACEWARLGVIGQLWNAVGYSQAFRPELIQAARFGGVYAVGFLVLSVNAALAYALVRRDARGLSVAAASVACVALALFGFAKTAAPSSEGETRATVVALQPNVVPDFNRSAADYDALAARHFELSAEALRKIDESGASSNADAASGEDCGCGFGEPVKTPPTRVVVWPESPMNFSYGRRGELRENVARFVRDNRASLLINSLEPTKDGGGYNAAVLINEEGRVAAQYDKIRLMPFGEYVPLPRWMPGAGLVRGVVGDFTPGERYTLMPLGDEQTGVKAGVFICLESAYPYITRRFAEEGADVLVEMTNDAYQGDTAVMRQHLSNAVLRAVETGRTLLRVTNTGVSARVSPRGEVSDETGRFQEAVRTWEVARSDGRQTFYVRFGDSFAAACAFASCLALSLTLRRRKSVLAGVQV
jgi:apolipoprotein N-acyltransferase